MKNLVQQIKWSEQCGDPGCRVFFMGDRVFRAYTESRRQETLDFLQSECYAELLSKQMIVKTWVTNDIRIDGYSLILEHEKLCFMPEEWFCFDMLKDVLAFHFEVNALCRKYGYGLRDIGYGNVTLNNGKFCFTDFGSFRRSELIDNAVYLQHGLPLAFLPIALYSKNDGNDFLARSLITNYSTWGASTCMPVKDNLLHDRLRPYLHPIVSYYDMYWRSRYSHFKTNNETIVKLVGWLNITLRMIFSHKPSDWDFIKAKNVYSEEKAVSALKQIQFPYTNENIYPIRGEEILRVIPDVIIKHIKNPIKRIVLWGNFQFDSIKQLKELINGEVIVMSNDRIYTNNLYKQTKEKDVDIWVVCCNVMRGKQFDLFKRLKTDLLVMQNEIYNQAREFDHSDWAEKASYYASYVLIQELDEDEAERTKLLNFWNIVENTEQYKLYERKNVFDA